MDKSISTEQVENSFGPAVPKPRGIGKRVLVSTLWPTGGVASMTNQICKLLAEKNFQVELAYYMPYSMAPELSALLHQTFNKTPAVRETTAFEEVPAHQVGVRFPEFEWSRYLAGSTWKGLLANYDHHISVSGSILAALPAVLSGKPCLAWVATPYWEDRADRIKEFPWYRRIIDALCDAPICLLLERKALRQATVLALSDYTYSALNRLVPGGAVERMPVAPEAELFPHKENRRLENHIRFGFVGRTDDPRKNIGLLLETLQACLERGADAELTIVGADLPALEDRARSLGLENRLKIVPEMKREQLSDVYSELDVFVIPSHQEGLAIVGLEAMSSGCPVVSTRCGGPEEYINDGVNGYLTDFSAAEIAEKILAVTNDEDSYLRMSRAAVETIENRYNQDLVESTFWQAFEKTFQAKSP